MKKAAIAALAALAVWATAAWAGEAARVFPIPRYEAEQVITAWLKAGGYEARGSACGGEKRITGTGKSGSWDITLEHHSSLATRVVVNACPKGRDDDLWEYLSSYLHTDARAMVRRSSGIPAAVAARMSSVVCIRAVAGGSPIQLTGFAVDSSGLILCTAHTLVNPEDISIVLSDGSSLTGRLVKIDFKKDLALIDCNHVFARAVSLAAGAVVPEAGRRVFSVGCPLNLGGTLSTGIMNRTTSLVQGQPLLQVKMDVEPGSSGSPVFDEQGGLVAVVKGRIKAGNSTGLLIPMETVISFVKGK